MNESSAAGESPAGATSPLSRALEIRIAQGWKLKGDCIPVLYTDTINGNGVGRDDLWLCTSEALETALDQSWSVAYKGAREDLAIWKKRALEAEALNRKFIADINGPTFVGEPAYSDDALLAREMHESQDDSLLLCASDLQHSAICDSHVEMQSCMLAVADRIAVIASKGQAPDGATSNGIPVEAGIAWQEAGTGIERKAVMVSGRTWYRDDHQKVGPPANSARYDAELLDWIEEQARKSPTGISFDWVRHAEEGAVLEQGYRFMRRHFLGERKATLRAAIQAARTITE